VNLESYQMHPTTNSAFSIATRESPRLLPLLLYNCCAGAPGLPPVVLLGDRGGDCDVLVAIAGEARG
jgi:hypothetical protein